MENKKNVLWVSPYAPYDKVAHAGGKVHNYYVKYFHKSGKFNIHLLSLCLKDEENKLDLDKYGIKNSIFVMDRTRMRKLQRRATSAWSYINPFDKYAGGCLDYERNKILGLLDAYIEEGNSPDIVILQWTFSVLLIPTIKKYFPNCKIVAIEEDVTFLGYFRKWKNAQSHYSKWFWNIRYKKMYQIELAMLNQADLVVTNNGKDTKLLRENGLLSALFTSVPYFDDYSLAIRKYGSRDVLFFGAMSRAENYESAIWFIKNVMPALKKEKIRFVIVGGGAPQELLKEKSEHVLIKGFVEDVMPYFENAMCFAAPLLYGAGIKVKILEALSAGIPVLTNEVGIEGIGAVDGEEYIHCEEKEEYIEAIRKILNGEIDVQDISQKSQKFIKENYHLDQKLDELIETIVRS